MRTRRRQRRGRLSVSNSPVFPPTLLLPSAPRTPALSSPETDRLLPCATAMQHNQHPDTRTSRPTQSPVVRSSSKSSRSRNGSSNSSSSSSYSSGKNNSCNNYSSTRSSLGHERSANTRNGGQIDKLTDSRTKGIQVRLPAFPPQHTSAERSPRSARYSNTHSSRIDTHSPHSPVVTFPRADPLGLGLEPQNLSTYLPKEPP